MVFQLKIKFFILVSAACAVGGSTQEISEDFCRNTNDKLECFPHHTSDVAKSSSYFDTFLTLRHSSIVFGILEAVQDNYVDATCAKDAKRIIDGVKRRETWAMRVLDASGTKGAGFVIGNTHWLGSKTTCDSIGLGYKISMSDRFERNTVPDLLAANAPILVQFRMVYAKHSSPWQMDMKFMEEHILHIGLCLPSSCSSLEVQAMVQNYFLNSTASAHLESLELNAKVLQVKDLRLRDGFAYKNSLIIFLFVSSICLSLTAIAYYLDKLDGKASATTPASNLKRLILHFSPKRNLLDIYSTKSASQTFSILCGLKSISCIFLLISHAQWFGFFSIKYKSRFFQLNEGLTFQWLNNGTLLVQVFFVVSGFLMTRKFLSNIHQMEQIRTDRFCENVKRFGRIVLQRYLRIVPLYFSVILCIDIVFTYMGDTSIFYMQDNSAINCQRYWWRNVFFIQNLFNFNDMCACWSWSLACEMQFYILFMLLLFIFAKNNWVGLRIFISLAAVVFITTLYLALKFKYMLSWDVVMATVEHIYHNPITRMPPYFLGVAGGWIYVTFKDKALHVSKEKMQQITILSSLTILLPFITIGERDRDYRIVAPMFATGLWIHSTAIISLILVNLFGHQNTLTRFLSARFFVHISKLEYAIYLLNPLVATVLADVPDTGLSMDNQSIVVRGLIVAIVTYSLAVFFTIVYEMPLRKLCDEVFSKK